MEALGPFKSGADLEPVMCVLERWTRLLEFDLFHGQEAPEGQRKMCVFSASGLIVLRMSADPVLFSANVHRGLQACAATDPAVASVARSPGPPAAAGHADGSPGLPAAI